MGAAAAIGAFGLWALFPIYFNQFGPDVSAWEILLHRMTWAGVVLLGFVLVSKRLDRVRALIKRPRAMLALAGSALSISVNWATFIWAVTHGEILQSSLGYYISPLLNVLLGYCFLGERLEPLQRLAVAIAAAGVLLSLIGYGQVPWLALIMAATFGFYGLIRKQVDIDSITGLMMETMLMLPIAAGWLIAMHMQGGTVFLRAGLRIDLLLIGAGIVTLLPLMFFAAAARRLRLATLGLVSYIAPTGHFLSSVFLYAEPFTAADALTFACIWAGLILYTADMWQRQRKQPALK
ncbi:MAG: EamA family transporter RarD [Desulfobacteraceae bacterium]|nr:MAG: EamA family transporter RarD [Desulfobacteraceae bacterium]